MSGTEFEAAPPQQKSSVKVSTSAAGNPQPEIRVIEGAIEAEIERIREMATRHWHLAKHEVQATPAQTLAPAATEAPKDDIPF